MSFELKIVGQIPLDQLERGKKKKSPESYAPLIKEKLKLLAEKVNERHGNILEADGRIKITDEADRRFVEIKEGAWAQESGLSLEEFKRKQEVSSSALAEQAITLSLAKVLGSRFLSVRASFWDDYENGVDNLLLDLDTGSVICGFDEVIEGYHQKGGEKKEKKIMDKFSKGGSFVKYGLKSVSQSDAEVAISKQSNLPTFFVAINKEELAELLEKINEPEISAPEKRIIGEMIGSLEEQMGLMNNQVATGTNPHLADNLKRSVSLISVLKEKIGSAQ